MPFQAVAGQQTYYVRRHAALAAQIPLVFIHGAGGTHQHWLLQVRDLVRAPVFAIDLPGHGRTEAPGRASIQSYACWLISFLDALELKEVVLVGHSMGGGIALSASMDYPDRVAALGLVATGARLRVAPPLLEALRQDPAAAVQTICGSAFGPSAPPEILQQGAEQMGAVPADVLYDDFKACDGFDVMDRLGEISAPTLVLCGSQDLMTPCKYSLCLRDHIPGAVLLLVEGAGHMVMIERPGRVTTALETLLVSL